MAEVHAERVDPEASRVLWIAGRDMAGDTFVEPVLREEAEGRGEPLLPVAPLLRDRLEHGRARKILGPAKGFGHLDGDVGHKVENTEFAQTAVMRQRRLDGPNSPRDERTPYPRIATAMPMAGIPACS